MKPERPVQELVTTTERQRSGVMKELHGYFLNSLDSEYLEHAMCKTEVPNRNF